MPTARGRLIALAAGLCLAGCGPPAERALQGYVEGEYVRVAAPFAGTAEAGGAARCAGRFRRAAICAGKRQ
jgi:hypothetical protein